MTHSRDRYVVLLPYVTCNVPMFAALRILDASDGEMACHSCACGGNMHGLGTATSGVKHNSRQAPLTSLPPVHIVVTTVSDETIIAGRASAIGWPSVATFFTSAGLTMGYETLIMFSELCCGGCICSHYLATDTRCGPVLAADVHCVGSLKVLMCGGQREHCQHARVAASVQFLILG
jgi:hypothetical protein